GIQRQGTVQATTENFTGNVAQGATNAVGPFAVTAGTTFRVVMTGTGDADLYVRFGSAPTASSYNCRPYLNGSSETCDLTVPTGITTAYVSVVGYTAASYSLAVTYTKGGTTPPPTGGGTPQTATVSGSVSRGQFITYNPVTVKPGTALTVTMSGSGDPDLYVRFAGAPTTTLYDCRPYKTGAAETCSLTVPASATAVFLGVNGYQAASYSITMNYVAP
ncbi:MAG: PPC domain-containing protein, partial [Archangium sp.]